MIEKRGVDWIMSPEKRAIDIVLSTVAHKALKPFADRAAHAIQELDGQSPYFEQQRIGQYGQLFTMPKIRTMAVGTEQTSSTGHGDERRLGSTGRLISTLRIDEVPQLKLVRQGKMSFFAPRAILPIEYEEIMDKSNKKEQSLFQEAILTNKPGMVDPHCIGVHTGDFNDAWDTRRDAYIDYARDASLVGDMLIAGSVPTVFGKLGFQALRYQLST